MENRITQPCHNVTLRRYASVMTIAFFSLWSFSSHAQCDVQSGQIKGIVFNDINNNGAKDSDEVGLQGILIQAYGNNGALLTSELTNARGEYALSGLSDGKKVRINFSFQNGYYAAKIGVNNASAVQFVQTPSCNVNFGLTSDLDICNSNTEIITTCFVQGETTFRPEEPTIVGINYGFNSASPARKFAMHGETGSIWGLAYRSKSNEIFSSALIKQYAGLKAGHDAIFKSAYNGSMFQSDLFVKLSDLGQDVGTLTTTDVANCTYGDQVGKMGLGSMVISPDEQYLYVVNIYNNTLVRILIDNPTPATTVNYQIPGAGVHAFALKYYNGHIYIGTTKPGNKMYVWEFNPKTGSFKDTGLAVNAGSNWSSTPIVGGLPAYWLTDIDFTDNGDMLLSLSDRIGHAYCNDVSNRLDEQKGDLMIAYKNNNGGWTLEDRSLDGEFFSDDFWIANPTYHPEITTGSIFAMPGTGSVVSTVFDPEMNSYSGGLHRYNTTTGKKEGSKELYTRNSQIVFGKATGFGDIIPLCGLPDIEIGNLIWFDANKNGIQDANEIGIAGIKVILLDDNCNILGNTLTDAKGNYVFNRSNVAGGISRHQQYYIGIDPAYYDASSEAYLIEGQYYLWTTSNVGTAGINSVAGITPCPHAVAAVEVTGTNHNFDLGFVASGDCKLKISKKVVNAAVVKFADAVNFEIEVFNNGTQTVQDVQIQDDLPTTYLFNHLRNPEWTIIGNTITATLNGTLLPGESKKIQLVLNFKGSSAVFPNYENEVSVIGLKDILGNEVEDIAYCFEQPEERISRSTPDICDLALKHAPVKGLVYYPDNKVSFKTTIYNQGTIDATGFTVVNYLNDALDFNPALNPGWTISEDLSKLFYIDNNTFQSGEIREIELNLELKDAKNIREVINYAEIAAQTCGVITSDFDSNPDLDSTNDIGGVSKSPTDDLVSDHGAIDEDDHDPALILNSNIDLTLKKSVPNHRIKPGDEVVWNISIINSGSSAVSKVKLYDFLPSYIKLTDEDWTWNGELAEREVTFPGNLQPGQTFNTTIRTVVSENTPLPLKLVNVATVKEIYDEFGVDVSNPEFDNKLFELPDPKDPNIAELPTFDNQYDDDYDQDFVLMFPPIEYTTCASCRTATSPTNGQFVTSFKIISVTGDNWFVESSNNLYDISSPLPPNAPVILADETYMTETPLVDNPGFSEFTFSAVHIDGQAFAIRFRNDFGDLEQVEVTAGTCTFTPLTLTGQQSLCIAGVADYSVKGAPLGSTFNWFVDDIQIPGVTGSSTKIDWTGYSEGAHELKVEMVNADCVAPAVLNVAIGAADLSSIACIGNFNVSLGKDCATQITPQMLVAGKLNPNAPYVVLLTDMNNNPIPNAIITKAHIGTIVMATLQEGCGGNSCWSMIKVEDKTPPVSICRDITLPCYKLDEYEGPFEEDNCGGIVNNIIVSEKITRLDCNPNYICYIDRVYQATDEYGNKSALCNMRIALERPDLSKIVMPLNYTMANGNPLTCNGFLADDNGLPILKVTGVPTLAGISLYPDFAEVCNLSVWYEDQDFGYVGCLRKIIRHWYVYEAWCSSYDVKVYDQLIEIVDDEAPVINPVNDLTVSTTGRDLCEAKVRLPRVVASDNCSGIFRIDVTHPGGFIQDYNGNSEITLSAGEHLITYTAYDNCKNSASTSFVITVEDKTAPTVICKGNVVVGLDTKGNAYLYPKNVDDGSFDGCGLDDMKIAKMGNYTVVPDSAFHDYIQFDCSEVGADNMVVLKVWDLAGNSNACMINVEVQDKHAPTIICPSDLTIDCSDVYTGMDLTQYGTALAIDACNVELITHEPEFTLSACRTGIIERTFSATDHQSTATCKQIITVENGNYFDPVRDVVFPKDYTITNSCSATDMDPENLPEEYGYPIITQAACGLAAASYRDYVYDFVKGACYKIIRQWTVIDWCEMERLGSYYTPYEFQQTIIVINTEPPFFVNEEPVDTTFYTEKGNCESGRVTLTYVGKDLCTPDNKLRWRYVIDLYNDKNPAEDVVNNGFGNTAHLDAILPVGTHRITWSFEDQCGNIVTKTHLVTVVNNDKPIVVAHEKVSVGVIPWDTDGDGIPDVEKACITASSLDLSSVSACCEGPLKFSFSADVLDTIACFTCYHVGYPTTVELWATDCNGNQDFVIVDIDVQDNNDSDVCEKICENFPTVAVISGKDNICEGEEVTLTASGGKTYVWSTGDTTSSITVNPNTTTTYSVTVTNEYRCVDEASITVLVNKYPQGEILGNNVCLGESTTLTATGGTTYLWETGETTSSIVVAPTETTTYTVTITNDGGCSAVLSKEIEVYLLPEASITGNSFICIGSNTDLTAHGGESYVWSTGETTETITVSPTSTTTYTVTVTGIEGCSATASIEVTVNGLSISAVVTGNDNICQGQSTTLTGQLNGGTAVSYIWNTGSTLSSITVSPDFSTTYVVTITDTNGCTASASKFVLVNELPDASINGPDDVCIGSSATLFVTGGIAYEWNTGETTASIVVTPINPTTYTVTVTNAAGCTAIGSKLVDVHPLPVVTISGDTEICINEQTTLTVSGGETYVWSTGETTESITVAPLTTTTYSVTTTDSNGCMNDASITVVVNGLLINASIDGNDVICEGDSTELTALLTGGTAISYLWSTGETTESITVSPTSTSTYSVTIEDTNGCKGTASITIDVNPLPLVNIDGPDAICEGTSAELTATGGTNYVWSTGETNPSIIVTPLTSTTYTVTVTNDFGCETTASKFVVVNASVPVVITGNDVICLGDATTLTASGGLSYIWSTGETTPSITVSPAMSTTYTVTATDDSGCDGTASVTVSVNGTDNAVTILGQDSICIGSTTELTAVLNGGVAVSYEWSTGETTETIIVTITEPQTYSVTVLDANGCVSVATKTVYPYDLPIIVISGDVEICIGSSTTLTASGAEMYVWSTGDTTATITVIPADNTTYTVTATDINGCVNTAEATVTLLPLPNISIVGADSICVNTTVDLKALGGVSYVWSTGDTNDFISVSPITSTTYTVTGTDSNGCSNVAEHTIHIYNQDPVTISGEFEVCAGESVMFTASEGVDYQWSSGHTTREVTLVFTDTTEISVTVTDVHGCIGIATVTINVDKGDLVCSTKDITVYLDDTGSYIIMPEEISTGSISPCSNIIAFVTPAEVNCNDATLPDPVLVTLTVVNTNTNDTLTCTALVTVIDTIKPTLICPANLNISCDVYDPTLPLSTYGLPTTTDNCLVQLQLEEESIIDVSECNVGLITRTFTATDISGNSTQCVQLITIFNDDPITINDIAFPSDVTITDCDSTDPSDIGFADVDAGNFKCGNINISYTDNIPTSLCEGVFERVWTVVDSCQLVPGTNDGIWTATQSVTVNVIPPVISGPDTIYIYRDSTTCSARLEGDILHTVTGCNLTLTVNGIEVTDFNLNGEYTDGEHVFLLVAISNCNTAIVDSFEFVLIVQGVEEHLYCTKTYPELDDDLTVVDNVYDHATIIQGCPNGPKIFASFSNIDMTDTLRTYTCNDLPNAPIGVFVYFWREGENAPFSLCQSLVGLKNEYAPFCPDSITVQVDGIVKTANGEVVEDVNVQLLGSNLPDVKTNKQGQYAFPSMPGGGTYDVIPVRDINPLDGVSTLDLVYIQRHILEVELLNSPYKIIAADINKDERVTASDLTQLRKLLLGIYDKFPNNTSWRMIDKNYVFPTPKDPFQYFFPESYHIESLGSNMHINWVGVKIGDVNDSFTSQAKGQDTEFRNAGLQLTVADQILHEGKNIIPIYADQASQIFGFQAAFTMHNANDVYVVPGLLPIHLDNYVYSNGELKISWSNADGIEFNTSDVLFFIQVDANNEMKVSNAIKWMPTSNLSPEFYNASLKAEKLGWRVVRDNIHSFEINGNVPNPWNNETQIQFYIPEDGEVSIRIMDVTGRVVFTNRAYFKQGDNAMRISKDDVDVTGLLMYELNFGGQTKVSKMLNIK